MPQMISYSTFGRQLHVFDDLDISAGPTPALCKHKGVDEEFDYYVKLEFVSPDTLKSMAPLEFWADIFSFAMLQS